MTENINVTNDDLDKDDNDEYLVVQASARFWTFHPAVTGKECAAPAETEAVLGVLAE